MSKEQKRFLKKVRESWNTEFPFLELVDLEEIPKMSKGCNFRCKDYFLTRGVCYFVTFDFSQRRQGEFLIGITVSPSPQKSVLSPPIDYTPTPTNIGSYNMAVFLGRQSFCWDMVDEDTKMNAIMVSLGGELNQTPGYVPENVWKPSSYALPFERIVEETICDVNEKLRRFVFPILEIVS
jgi:hypothetical protein